MIRLEAFLALVLFTLSGCPLKDGFKERSYFLMGTFVTVTLPSGKADEFKNLSALMAFLAGEAAEDCAALSASEESVRIGAFTCRVLKEAEFYYGLTKGRFNPGIFTVASLYGFPEGPYSEPDDGALEKALELARGRISLLENREGCFASAHGMKVDLGALAKGAAADEAAAYLKSRGINDFIINAGGDLYASGSKNGVKWRIGIRDPEKKGGTMEAVELENMALATSGTYERYFTAKNGRRISHLFDGITGETADKYVSLSVIAGRAAEADALSTAYFFMNEEEIEEACAALYTPVMLITADGERRTFCGWPGRRD